MSPTQQKLLSLFDQMDVSQQQKLLEMAEQLLNPPRLYTGQELMALSFEERERLVAKARSTQEHAALPLQSESEENANQ